MADRLCGRLQSGKGGFDSLSWLDHKRFNASHHQIHKGRPQAMLNIFSMSSTHAEGHILYALNSDPLYVFRCMNGLLAKF